jgi:hypothetical protein
MIIVEYQIGDGYTFNADQFVPISGMTRDEVNEAFDLAMAAYEPGKTETFEIAGVNFRYEWFIYWSDKQVSKRKTIEIYDSMPPRLYSEHEWMEEMKRRHALDINPDKHVSIEELMPSQAPVASKR